MEGYIGGVFGQHAQCLKDRLPFGPGPESLETQKEPAPSRWTLQRIAKTFSFFAGYSLAGVSKAPRTMGICLRQGRLQQWSPDPHYQKKLEHLLAVLRDVAAHSHHRVALFLDEMGYFRWPDAAPDWCQHAPASVPLADRKRTGQLQWRVIGALDALRGRVLTLDGCYIVGRQKVAAFLQQIDQAYPESEEIYVIMDNWSIHQHEDVKAVLATLPRLEVVWLPTYAPWLNPIEKLWRKFRQEIWYLHRFADQWDVFQQRVHDFFCPICQHL